MDFITGFILIIFAVLQIILFFKLWRMTNDVKSINDKITHEKEFNAEYFILIGESETARNQLMKEFINSLLLQVKTNPLKTKELNRIIEYYVPKIEKIGYSVPLYLKTPEDFIDKLKSIYT